MEPTSEQELKQLLDEGRITEEEYQELLEAIRQKETVQKPVDVPQKETESKPRTGYGKAALILMIVGLLVFLLPLILNVIFLTADRSSPGVQIKRSLMLMGCPFLFLGFLCELLAFIFGIIGWKTAQGKIAAIGVPCLGLLIVPGLLLLSLFHFRVSSVEQERAKLETKRIAKVEELKELASKQIVSHKAYSLDSMEGVLTQDGIELDNHISADGNGSLKITSDSDDKTVIRLFETGPMGIDNRMLIYSAKVRVSGMPSEAYLEMWCDISGKGEFFSRNLEQSVMGTTEWTTVQTPFRLKAGQIPANVKLNLVIEGAGTVWIDDIKLLSSPLN